MISLRVIRPVVCKVLVDRKDFENLKRTVETFQSACNYISQVAFKKDCFDPIALHALVYQKVRAIFKLPANLAIQARNRGQSPIGFTESGCTPSAGTLWPWTIGSSRY